MKTFRETMEDANIVVIMETGANNNSKLRDLADELDLSKENKMKQTDKEQYQHNGNGTAIFTHYDYEYQPTRKMFNNHKMITQMMKTGDDVR